jgi:hypothetical protein
MSIGGWRVTATKLSLLAGHDRWQRLLSTPTNTLLVRCQVFLASGALSPKQSEKKLNYAKRRRQHPNGTVSQNDENTNVISVAGDDDTLRYPDLRLLAWISEMDSALKLIDHCGVHHRPGQESRSLHCAFVG